MSAKKNTKKLRYAIVGCGMISGAHLNALKYIDEAEVVGLCDLLIEKAHDRAEQFDVPKEACYKDCKKMFKELKPDVVSVCTPNGQHCPVAIAASKAGCHVITEKPMAMSPAECKKMIAAAKAAKKKLAIGFQHRFTGKSQYMRRMYDEGVFGDIKFARVQALRRRGIPNWGVFGQKHLQGGGPMIDIGVHALEMCHYAMGAPKPVAAVGMTSTYIGNKKDKVNIVSNWPNWDYKTYTVEDLAIGHVRMETGAVIHIEASFAAHIAPKNEMDYQLMGTKGGCKYSEGEVYTDQNGHMVTIKPDFFNPYGSGGFEGPNSFFTAKLRDFTNHILNGTPTIIAAENGLMVQQMLSAIYESADKGGKEVLIK